MAVSNPYDTDLGSDVQVRYRGTLPADTQFDGRFLSFEEERTPSGTQLIRFTSQVTAGVARGLEIEGQLWMGTVPSVKSIEKARAKSQKLGQEVRPTTGYDISKQTIKEMLLATTPDVKDQNEDPRIREFLRGNTGPADIASRLTKTLVGKPFKGITGVEHFTRKDGTPGSKNTIKAFLALA